MKGKQAGEKARRAEEEARKVVRRRTRDERPQSTQHRPAKIAWNTPGIYYPHGGVPAGRGASTTLGQGVAYPGTAPKEEKRAREEPHDWPRHADGNCGCI